MESISLFFSKYQNLGLEQKLIRRSAIEALKEVCGVDVEKEQIKIIRGEIIVLLSGSAKSQILIKKNTLNKKFLEKINSLGIDKDRKIS
jgi:hypothetical protein